MLKVRKGNRILKISDDKKEVYKKLGYKITTMEGEVLFEPNNAEKEAEKLRVKVDNLIGQIAELTAENEQLKGQIAELTAESGKKEPEQVEEAKKESKEAAKTSSKASNTAKQEEKVEQTTKE